MKKEQCKDCISRATAIKAMEDLEQNDIELYGCNISEGFDGRRAVEVLESLPSVAQNQTDVLEKIRAEIDMARFVDKDTRICKNALSSGLEVAMQIIDKYKAESEE